jgi:hypothetical protein
MDNKYVSRYIPVNAEKLEIIKTYHAIVEAEVGFKISLSDAIIHAIKRVTKETSNGE